MTPISFRSDPAPLKAADFGITPPLRPWGGHHVVVPISTAQLTSLLRESLCTSDDLSNADDLSRPSSPEPSPSPARPRPSSQPSSALPAPTALPASPSAAGDAGPRRKRKIQARAHQSRKAQRHADQAAHFGDAPAPSKAGEKYVGEAVPIYTALNSKTADVVSTGFTAFEHTSADGKLKERYTLRELVEDEHLSLHHWDGKLPMAIVDLDGRIVGILAGVPDAADWDLQHRAAAELLEDAGKKCTSSQKSANHRRGEFTTLRCGFSHGGGTTKPTNCVNTKGNQRIIDALVSAEPFRRIAGFGSCVLKTWAPKLHKHYVDKLGKVQQNHPHLKRPFGNSVFPSTTFNLGPRTVCHPHRDFGNLPFGLCVITALGSFDPKKGGHLVLWELGLVIEFPAGSTILIPSAIITHFNTPVGKSENRYSCTQYAAGGLFRWAEHNCKLTDKHRRSLSPKELAELDLQNDIRKTNLGLRANLVLSVRNDMI